MSEMRREEQASMSDGFVVGSVRRSWKKLRSNRRALAALPGFVVLSVVMAGCVSVSNYRVNNAKGTTANLLATVTYQQGDYGTYYWQLGPQGTPTWTTFPVPPHSFSTKDSAGGGTKTIVEPVSALDPNTSYRFRLCGKGDGMGFDECVDKDGNWYDPTSTGSVWQDPATFWSGKTGQFPGLDMGFGEQKSSSDSNWLQLNNDAQGRDNFTRKFDGDPTSSVAALLDYDKADWVVGTVEWKGLANGNGYTAIRDWAQKAANNDKYLLFTIGWNPPTTPPNDYADKYGLQPVPSQDAQDNLRDVAHNVWLDLHGDAVPGGDYNGGGSDLTGDVRLEIGTETNWNADLDNDGKPDGDIWPVDARFWWDAINRVAHDSNDPNNPWQFGKGIVTGGVFTKPGGNSDQFGWSSGFVNAGTYLKAAIGGRKQDDPWTKHWDHPYFDAYGIHAGHRSDLDERTTWGDGPDGSGGIQERVNLVTDALNDANVPSNTNIEITALLPTDTTAATDRLQLQANDTTPIWDQLRSGKYDHSGQYPLNLVIWNHIVDTGQDNFPCTGFVQDGGPSPGNCNKDNLNFPYIPKQVWRDAHDWAH